MHFLTFDGLIVATALLLEAVLAFTLLRRGLASTYPIFLIYLLLNLIEDPVALILQTTGPNAYVRFYFAITVLDYLLQLLILVEVARNVLRPSKRAMPFPVWPVALVGVLICAIGAAAVSPQLQTSQLHHASQVFFRVTLGLAALKLLLFALLAAFSQFLGIGWKNHVLQLASGLALYGAASLLIQLGISHLPVTDPNYLKHLEWLSRSQSVSYNATLGFWLWAFSRNEAPRKDFTPQMQQVLVTIAATARRTRLAVTRSGGQP